MKLSVLCAPLAYSLAPAVAAAAIVLCGAAQAQEDDLGGSPDTPQAEDFLIPGNVFDRIERQRELNRDLDEDARRDFRRDGPAEPDFLRDDRFEGSPGAGRRDNLGDAGGGGRSRGSPGAGTDAGLGREDEEGDSPRSRRERRQRRLGDDAPRPQRQGGWGLSLETENGDVIVSGVRPGSMGAMAGLRPGDELVSVDGRRRSAGQFRQLLREAGGRDAIEIVVHRDGSRQTVLLNLDELRRISHFGVTFGSGTTHPLAVLAVDPNSPAGRLGLREQDLVVSVDGLPVASRGDFYRQIRQPAAGRPRELVVLRDGRERVLRAGARPVEAGDEGDQTAGGRYPAAGRARSAQVR
jgi:hypothetical protein